MTEYSPIADHDAVGQHLTHDLEPITGQLELQIVVDALYEVSDARFRQSINNVLLPPLDDVLADLNEMVSTGQLTFAEAKEALEDYGQEE